MTNKQLAADLVARADYHLGQRRILLVASVALNESTSIPAAIKILRQSGTPAELRDAALEVLDQLAATDAITP